MVHYLEDYRLSILLHKKRVQILGKELYQHYFSEFHEVPHYVLTDILSRHDQSKLIPENLHRLFHFYRKNFGELPLDEQDNANQTKQLINSIDQHIANDIFKKYHLLNPDGSPSNISRKILIIEMIADVTDRAVAEDAKIEFARTLDDAVPFLGDLRVHNKYNKMANYLEKNYSRLVGHLSYKNMSLYSPQTCSDLLNEFTL